ncbi:hypothetical protein MASR1M46_12620 [Bacteroidales bacterium]
MLEVLPEAFAIVKSTARRFKENENWRLQLPLFDRDIFTTHCAEISGDKAIWKTSWMAGGNMIKWDMVHYDVQLIGGVVLHQGKLPRWRQGG